MYNPARYSSSSLEETIQIIESHPFATLITPRGMEAKITHLPLVVEQRADSSVLVGHMARANDHWKFLANTPSV